MIDSNSRNISRVSISRQESTIQVFCSALAFVFLFLAFPGYLQAQQGFFGGGMSNQTFKKQFKGGLYSLPNQSKNGINTENRYSKKEISFRSWDKHFSSLGQKKLYSDKSKSANFNQEFEKEVWSKKKYDLTIASWNQKLANIRKEAQINLSDEAHILGNREAYNLVLQERQFFRDMAESMDLRSINRYQFQSNRPEGPIPVDSVSNAEDPNK